MEGKRRERRVLGSIESEFRRYRHLGASAIGQLDAADLTRAGVGSANSVVANTVGTNTVGTNPVATNPVMTNSVATIAWHVAGNLRSRFTDFLTSDGEKSWRDRESEFAARTVSPDELLQHWDSGWNTLFAALDGLVDEDLSRDVVICSVPLTVAEALHRSLAHASYHVGQIVFLARSLRGDAWTFLSIPPGGSQTYNANPTLEKPPQAPA